MFSASPSLTPAQAVDILRNTSADLGPAGWDDQVGCGRIDALAALRMATGAATATRSCTPLAVATPTPTATLAPAAATRTPTATPVLQQQSATAAAASKTETLPGSVARNGQANHTLAVAFGH